MPFYLTVKTYEDMTLEELEENEDEFGEEDEAAIEMYRWACPLACKEQPSYIILTVVKVNQSTGFQMSESPNWTKVVWNKI